MKAHVQPPRLPRPRAALRRQLDQLGAHRRAGRSTTSPPRSRSARRTARSPSPCRPAISATSSPATSPQRMGLPIDRLVDRHQRQRHPGAHARDRRLRAARGGADHLAVDGHPGLVEFRAPAVRGLRPRRRGGARADGLARAVAAASRCPSQALSADPRAVHRRSRRRGGDRRDHPHRRCARPATCVDPHTAVGARRRREGNARSGGADDRAGTAHPAKFPDAVEAACGVAPGAAGLARRPA